MIFDDVLSALEAGRSPVVITERKDHLQIIAQRLMKFAKNVIVLKGGMTAKQRDQAMKALAAIPDAEERVIVATGRYLIVARHPRAICRTTTPTPRGQTGGRNLRLCRQERSDADKDGRQTTRRLRRFRIHNDRGWRSIGVRAKNPKAIYSVDPGIRIQRRQVDGR